MTVEQLFNYNIYGGKVMAVDTPIVDEEKVKKTLKRMISDTEIYSISDFKIPDNMKYLRFDKILDKLYMEGRLGGVPRIVSPSLPIYKYPEDRQ